MYTSTNRALPDKLARLAGLRRSGSGWSGQCPAHRDRHPSLSIGFGTDGRLLLHCFAGCTFQEIVAALGLSAADLRDLGCGPISEPPPPSREERLRVARRIWATTTPLKGTVAERYLENRGINVFPQALRFARLWSSEMRELRFPAMVAGVQDAAGEFSGVQVTYLAENGDGKAPFLATQKKCFGLIRGGAVRLGPMANTVCLAEGIETGLSILQATSIPTWAALGTPGIGNVELPMMVSEVVIAADADVAGIRAAEFARRRLLAQGRRVRIILPPIGNDFNEVRL